jgi:folate-binding protein YgfZ
MGDPLFTLLDDRGVLAVSGPDRRAFLQGLVSNDVEKIGADRACYAALLTAQGKYLHDFIMVEVADAIWLETEAARLAELKRRLAIYRLRAKVSLDARPDLAMAAVFGEGALAALALSDEAGAARPLGEGIALVDPRLPALGARLMLPRAELDQALRRAGFAQAEPGVYDRVRLGLGVPDGSRDLVVEKSILLESGFDELHGVDWRKGCYIGQELTARTKYRGLVKKRLLPVGIEGPPPPPGTIVTDGAREAGEMRSARGDIGLALLRLDAIASARPLTAGEARLWPAPPAWISLD